jgi:hypothetical protein
MPYPNTKQIDDSIDSKSKPLHSINIWTNNINNDINDPHITIPVTNTSNIEHHMIYNLTIIQLHNESNKKSQLLKIEISQNIIFMMMEEFEYRSLLKQLMKNKD